MMPDPDRPTDVQEPPFSDATASAGPGDGDQPAPQET